jgi:hypothetical protein
MLKYFLLYFCVISYFYACSSHEKIIGFYHSPRGGMVLTLTKDSFFYEVQLGDVGITHCEIKGTYVVKNKTKIHLKYTKPEDRIWGDEAILGKDSIKIAVFEDNMEELMFSILILYNQEKSIQLDENGEAYLPKKDFNKGIEKIVIYPLFAKPITYKLKNPNSDNISIFIAEEYMSMGFCGALDIGDSMILNRENILLQENQKAFTFTKKQQRHFREGYHTYHMLRRRFLGETW